MTGLVMPTPVRWVGGGKAEKVDFHCLRHAAYTALGQPQPYRVKPEENKQSE
jgi:hypothetical protein